MAKYGKKITKHIADMMKSDTYTLAEICRIVGIDQSTYHDWFNNYPEFADEIERAKAERMQFFVQEAKKSLLKKIQGYTVDETKVVTIPSKEINPKTKSPKPMIKEQTTTKKHIAPDTAAVIFTLTNGEPETWRNRQFNEVTGKDGKDLFATLTDAQLDEKIEELERKLKINADSKK